MGWEANMAIQPVFNYYKPKAYLYVYLSKSESECLLAMKQVVQKKSLEYCYLLQLEWLQ